MKLSQDQISILRDAKIEWNKLYLQWQLDRKQYVSINEVLETIGAKWSRKDKAHVFDGEMLEDAVQDIIDTGEVETLKETIKKFQFYPTPKDLAHYLVSIADVKDGDTILEPSAWMGNILDEIEYNYSTIVTAIEMNASYHDILFQKCDVLYIQDFLSFSWYEFSKIIMNPPFSKSQDIKHILHAYSLLADGGMLVSIASNGITFREWKLYDELRALNPEIIELPKWSFKESGTLVNTVIVKITK